MIIFLRDFDFDFDPYLRSFLTHSHARWSQNVIPAYTNLQLLAVGLLSMYTLLLLWQYDL